MVLPYILEVPILTVLFVLPDFLLEINLRIIKVHQVFLLLLMGQKGFSLLNFFLMSIIKRHHVPHRNFGLIARAADGLPSYSSLKVILWSRLESTAYGRGGLRSQVLCLMAIIHNTFTFDIIPKAEHAMSIRRTPWWSRWPLNRNACWWLIACFGVLCLLCTSIPSEKWQMSQMLRSLINSITTRPREGLAFERILFSIWRFDHLLIPTVLQLVRCNNYVVLLHLCWLALKFIWIRVKIKYKNQLF